MNDYTKRIAEAVIEAVTKICNEVFNDENVYIEEEIDACLACIRALDLDAIIASVPEDKPHKLLIRNVDDESVEYSLDGHDLINANHDDHGWSGMEAIEKTMLKVAGIIGATVEESHE